MWLPCLLHVCSDVPVLRGTCRPQTVLRLGALRVSCQRFGVKMLVDWMNRISERGLLIRGFGVRVPGGAPVKFLLRATQRGGSSHVRVNRAATRAATAIICGQSSPPLSEHRRAGPGPARGRGPSAQQPRMRPRGARWRYSSSARSGYGRGSVDGHQDLPSDVTKPMS